MTKLTITRISGSLIKGLAATSLAIGLSSCVTDNGLYTDRVQGVDLDDYLEELEQNPTFSDKSVQKLEGTESLTTDGEYLAEFVDSDGNETGLEDPMADLTDAWSDNDTDEISMSDYEALEEIDRLMDEDTDLTEYATEKGLPDPRKPVAKAPKQTNDSAENTQDNQKEENSGNFPSGATSSNEVVGSPMSDALATEALAIEFGDDEFEDSEFEDDYGEGVAMAASDQFLDDILEEPEFDTEDELKAELADLNLEESDFGTDTAIAAIQATEPVTPKFAEGMTLAMTNQGQAVMKAGPVSAPADSAESANSPDSQDTREMMGAILAQTKTPGHRGMSDDVKKQLAMDDDEFLEDVAEDVLASWTADIDAPVIEVENPVVAESKNGLKQGPKVAVVRSYVAVSAAPKAEKKTNPLQNTMKQQDAVADAIAFIEQTIASGQAPQTKSAQGQAKTKTRKPLRVAALTMPIVASYDLQERARRDAQRSHEPAKPIKSVAKVALHKSRLIGENAKMTAKTQRIQPHAQTFAKNTGAKPRIVRAAAKSEMSWNRIEIASVKIAKRSMKTRAKREPTGRKPLVDQQLAAMIVNSYDRPIVKVPHARTEEWYARPLEQRKRRGKPNARIPLARWDQVVITREAQVATKVRHG